MWTRTRLLTSMASTLTGGLPAPSRNSNVDVGARTIEVNKCRVHRAWARLPRIESRTSRPPSCARSMTCAITIRAARSNTFRWSAKAPLCGAVPWTRGASEAVGGVIVARYRGEPAGSHPER